MSVIGSNILAGSSSAVSDYEIDNSCRFGETSSGGKLTFTQGTPTGSKAFTYSLWFKGKTDMSGIDDNMDFTFLDAAATDNDFIGMGRQDGRLSFALIGGTGAGGYLVTTQQFRDPASWYHIVVAVNTEESVAADRMKMYKNGVQITAFDTENYCDEDYVLQNFNTSGVSLRIGQEAGSYPGGSYMAEVYFIDGSQLLPSVFGEVNELTNKWIPLNSTAVKSAVTFGNNGFYQKYGATELADSFTDSSGDHFTPTEDITCNLLLVAGGGAGGGYYGGGGGGGGVVDITGRNLTNGTAYGVNVGDGGTASTVNAGGSGSGSSGGTGGDTTFFSLTAKGGGGGGGGGISVAGVAGGSGGGGTAGSTSGGATNQSSQSGDSGTYGYGYAGGGASTVWGYASPGGGGAGEVGESTPDDNTGGAGGDGRASSITGSSVTYAGGGGGGSWSPSSYQAPGGAGGGGAGQASDGTSSVDGTDGKGGGGGGIFGGSATPSTGGSGVVIISYISTTAKATGGTITTYTSGDDTYQVHSFTTADGGPKTITANGDVTNTRAVRKIGDSSIVFDGTGDYLSVPDSTDWDFGTGDFTFESFVYVDSKHANEDVLFALATGPANLMFRVDDPGGSSVLKMDLMGSAYNVSHSLNEDTWYHVACVRDSGSLKFFVDGTQSGASQSATDDISVGYGILVGGRTDVGRYLTGYMDEIRISNSARYDGPFTPTTTEFTADANTKLLIHSNWDGGLGADSSGNYNTFTPTNLTASNQVVDTPTNNFATLNQLWQYIGGSSIMDVATWTEGNLKLNISGAYGFGVGTIIASSGKWYYEIAGITDNQTTIGAWDIDAFTTYPASASFQTLKNYRYYGNNGIVYDKDGATVATYSTYTTGDVIGCALDLDDNKIYFSKNGVWQGSSNPATGTNPLATDVTGNWVPGFTADTSQSVKVNFGQDSSFSGSETAQGNQDGNEKGDFYYTPPSGFLAMCEDNLPDPDIKLPGSEFSVLTWTGDTGDRDFTGVGFQPDLVWVKNTNYTYPNLWTDSVREAPNVLISEGEAAETAGDANGQIDAFLADGFSTINPSATNYYYNRSGYTYVAWNWRAGGAPTVDNTAGAGAVPTAGSVKIDGVNLGSAIAGTIAATRLSANTTSGMSIVQYTGTGSAATIAHGLGVKPAFMIIKKTNGTDDWIIWGKDLHGNSTLNALKMSGASYVSGSSWWNSTDPTTSVFSVGTNGATGAANEFIAYVFAEKEGYSKVFNYLPGTAYDGTFLYTGFKPAYWLVHMTDGPDGAGSWFCWDSGRGPDNQNNPYLVADYNYANETGSNGWDFLSNGLKMRMSISQNNTIGIAFAESPFKYTNAE